MTAQNSETSVVNSTPPGCPFEGQRIAQELGINLTHRPGAVLFICKKTNGEIELQLDLAADPADLRAMLALGISYFHLARDLLSHGTPVQDNITWTQAPAYPRITEETRQSIHGFALRLLAPRRDLLAIRSADRTRSFPVALSVILEIPAPIASIRANQFIRNPNALL